MPITLHDSLTRAPRELRRPDPDDPNDVFRFYNCGPTVYAPAHIGNFRTFVVNDLLRRLLELEFGKDKVKHVRNLTDVDDKTIRRAREEGRPLAEVTKQWTDKFHADCAALNCLPPHVEPTATGHIPEQIDMISALEKRGHAYRTDDGSVYFKVSSFSGYGALSRVKERELRVGSALAGKPQTHDADEKEDGSDFALWKGHKPDDGDNFWPSPWGRGRPGWHIECSAMSKKHLGDTIDLHTGGVDLLFPHHENEIAQSQCCNGTTFAHHWYHSEHLLVDGKKMSKSLGNLYTLDQLVQQEKFAPTIGRQLRLALIQAHPRKQLNFTLDSLRGAVRQLEGISACHQRLICGSRVSNGEEKITRPDPLFREVVDALKDDLNTPHALGELFSTINLIGALDLNRETLDSALAGFETAMFALGLQTDVHRDIGDEAAAIAHEAWLLGRGDSEYGKLAGRLLDLGWWIEPIPHVGFTVRKRDPRGIEKPPSEVTALAEERWAAKAAKNWAEADRLRGAIAALGWTMLDRKDGYSLEPAKK